MKSQFLLRTAKCILLLLIITLMAGYSKKGNELPNGFVFLTDVDPSIIESSRYYTDQNFLGRPVPGYTTSRIICTKEAAEQLKLIQTDLKQKGYKLVVYDGYRPQRSVDEFWSWSKAEADQTAKAHYYPTINKKNVFKLGYVAKKSSHSRGSSFDLTLIPHDQELKPITSSNRKLADAQEFPFLDDNTVDMGSSFDLFHEASHHDSNLVNKTHAQMRNLLRNTMKKHGFADYQYEWWHYTLENEPYPDTYFDHV